MDNFLLIHHQNTAVTVVAAVDYAMQHAATFSEATRSYAQCKDLAQKFQYCITENALAIVKSGSSVGGPAAFDDDA